MNRPMPFEPYEQPDAAPALLTPARAVRSRLLPALISLAGLELALGLLQWGARLLPDAAEEVCVICGVVFGIVYIAIILLRTRDLVRQSKELSPVDRALCRVSGIFAPLLLFLVIRGFSQNDTRQLEAILRSRWLLMAFSFVMDTILALSFACIALRGSGRHIPPLLLWKIVCVPVLVISGAMALFLMVVPLLPFRF
jgi:hypothetical protein